MTTLRCSVVAYNGKPKSTRNLS